ncbi:hypothetical protein [Bifidobacterium animalis]|uniref:hypothetical protein n=1 Tax=Bifidobacterium animalis TaxID=28025 RepID=UPI001C3E8824|nr:hypothetical protein [Bifidobacterium animalis]MCR1995058.1 hypothetical protein [Bifidobacterium animalis subsp. animalis]
MDDRTQWLVEHGYLSFHDGDPCLNADAFALVGNVSPERFRQGTHSDPDGGMHMDAGLQRDLKRGAQELMARYDSADMVEILYGEAMRYEMERNQS